VSPPAAAAAGTGAPHRTKLPTRPVGPTRPRRISGPVRPVRPVRPGIRDGSRQQAPTGLAIRVGALLGAVSRHRLLGRLIAGKAWIAVVAFALIGIVTLQLGLLELNRGIGRSLERQGTLQRENAALSVENSELAAGDRVESRAQSQGMELVSPGALHFLGSDPRRDIGKAAAALNVPVHSIDLGAGEGSASSTGAASSSASTGSSEQASAATEAGSATSPGQSQGEASATTSSAAASEPAAGAAPSGEVAAGAAPSEGSAPAASAPGPARTSSEQSSAGAGEAAEATSAGGAQASPSG